MENSALLLALAKEYGSKRNKVQITLRPIGEEDSYVIAGREASDCVVFYDPLNESAGDLSLIADGYVAHTEEEMRQLIEFIKDNPDIYAGKEGLSEEFAEYDEENWLY